MPTYDYDCPVHGRFEAVRRIAESASAPCPVKGCQSHGKQVFSPRGVTVAIPRRFLGGATKAEQLEPLRSGYGE